MSSVKLMEMALAVRERHLRSLLDEARDVCERSRAARRSRSWRAHLLRLARCHRLVACLKQLRPDGMILQRYSGRTYVSYDPIVPRFYRQGLKDQMARVRRAWQEAKTRRRIFRDYREHDWCLFLDGRMAAESLRVFTIDRTAEALALYTDSLFPSHQAHRESCTARATIYCASMAAAVMIAQYKKWAMGQTPEFHLSVELLSMDIYR